MLRSVENRVKWLLHELESFNVNTIKEELESLGFSGSKDERILGCYINDPAKHKDEIIVTDLGLHYWHGDQWIFLDYKLIQKVRFPDGGKANWKSLMIFQKGNEINLPVKNETLFKSGVKGWDVFPFRKFLDGIISSNKNKTS